MSTSPAHVATSRGQAWDDLDEAFPPVDSGHKPFGQYVIVQIRCAKTRTAGGLLLSAGDRDTEHDNTQVAKVVAIGPGCFKDRGDGTPWPEGAWFSTGAFVRCPKYGGDRWSVTYQRDVPERRNGNVVIPARTERDKVEFVMFKELDIRCGIVDPLAVKAFF